MQHDHSHDHEGPAHAMHGGAGHSPFATAAHATLHCLAGCVIGEFIGLAVGVSAGLRPYASMTLSTILAFISGLSLAVFPLMRQTRMPFKAAFTSIWLGEVLSIGTMELVMNTIDYHMGGVRTGSVFNPRFWEALAVAVPAGYAAALPVNVWLIGRQIKKACH